MSDDPVSICRKAYQAYVDKDRAAIEALIGDRFSFTSPVDNHLDRPTYFDRCWPNSRTLSDFKFINIVQDSERVFVTYECTTTGGKRFRNSEILTVVGSEIVEVEVYFGWSLPHRAPEGSFVAT